MARLSEYRYHLAALFTVSVWGATFVSTKALIAAGLTPAEIFLMRFALGYLCILPLAPRRLRAENLNDVRYGQCLRKNLFAALASRNGKRTRAAGRTSHADQAFHASLTGLTARENPKISQGMPDKKRAGTQSPNVGCQHSPCQG